jgi:nitroimidazol reductase NimA-like FMN-containing flavoprotein (pyridoxamine 5'-phosphate oxidase superfamily)
MEFRELNEQEIWCVIQQSSYVNLGLSDNNMPYIVPMYFEIERNTPKSIKLFSKPHGRKILCMANNEHVVLEFMCKNKNKVKSVIAFGVATMNSCQNEKGIIKIVVKISYMTGREYLL